MMTRCLLLTLLLWTAALSVSLATPNPEQVDRSIVWVVAPIDAKSIQTGTGFVINRDGYVITNDHVIRGGGEVFVLYKANKKNHKRAARVIWQSQGYDLAILKADDLDIPPLAVNLNKPRKTSKVSAAGFPGAAQDYDHGIMDNILESTWTQGIVSRTLDSSWVKGGPEFTIIQHSADINGGNSGGPLLDDCGRVIGVNTRASVTTLDVVSAGGTKPVAVGKTPRGIFYASHASAFAAALKKYNIGYQSGSGTCGMSSFDMANEDDWNMDNVPNINGLQPRSDAEEGMATEADPGWSNTGW